MTSHFAEGEPWFVVTLAGRCGRAARSWGDTVTSPASGEDNTFDPSGATNPRLGLALIVIATAQLMVVLDSTIVNVALPRVQSALGFSGSTGRAGDR
jgi:hypothetical protein